MSSRRKMTVTGVLLTVAVVGFYGVLQWQANPQVSQAVLPENTLNTLVPTTNPQDEFDPDDPGDPIDPGGGNPGGGGPGPPATVDVQESIVFVIDSSQHMYPRIGPNYFDMAKEAIVDFMDRPGFMTDGRFELVLQRRIGSSRAVS